MGVVHTYQTKVIWTGNRGTGTSGYREYDRAHEMSAPNLPVIPGSSDRSLPRRRRPVEPGTGPARRLSQCHLLSYLHVCVRADVIVTAYGDTATGTMEQSGIGGRFTEAAPHPHVTVASADLVDQAIALHDDAHAACFIAGSVNFPVHHERVVTAPLTSDSSRLWHHCAIHQRQSVVSVTRVPTTS